MIVAESAACALYRLYYDYSVLSSSLQRADYPMYMFYVTCNRRASFFFKRLVVENPWTKRTISRLVEVLNLRFIDMWPDSAYPNLYWSMYMATITILQYFQYSYVIAHFNLNNLTLPMDCLDLALTNTLVSLKLLVLWSNRR